MVNILFCLALSGLSIKVQQDFVGFRRPFWMTSSTGRPLKWYIIRDHSVHVPSQWGTTLHCNVVSHWLRTCRKWSLHNHWKSENLDENMSNFVIIVPADGLAPLGARASAGTMMTKSGSHIYTWPAPQGLTADHMKYKLGQKYYCCWPGNYTHHIISSYITDLTIG